MLKKELRGLKRSDFELVLGGGKSMSTPLFMAKWLETEKGFKVGVIISRKISKSAVTRNSIKRKIMAGIGGSLDRWEGLGVKLVLLVKKEITNSNGESIKTELDRVNEKIGFKNTSTL